MMNLESSDLLGSPSGTNSSAMSHASMDSVDLLSSPGVISLSSLGQIHENEPPQPSSGPPQEAFAEEQQNGEDKSQSTDKPIIYQIEFDVDHVGRNKPASKRMASFKYGIKRVSSTKIEEHEAQLTWSTHSGRWCVSVDGIEVYSGQAKGSVLDYKWKWNHIKACVTDNYGMEDEEPIVSMRMVACRKPPIRTSKEFRCYEFVIEGKPFRHLPTVNGACGEEMVFENENAASDGKLTTILDIVEPAWKAQGFV